MTDRIAVVTGGIRGIGRAVTLALSEAGYKVAAGYAARDEAAKMFTHDTGIPTYKWDVADFDACAKAVTQIEKDLGGSVDVLINNAGITRDGAMHKMGAEQWTEVVKTDLDSCFNMSRAVIENMRKSGFGRIVNISSINGQIGQFGQTNYSAAKAGVIGFTKALARESAFKGITVNAIAPGYIRTDMTADIDEKILEKIVAGIPVGRLGEATEIARSVMFLVAEEAGFITGETLSINGGQYMD